MVTFLYPHEKLFGGEEKMFSIGWNLIIDAGGRQYKLV